MKQDKRSTESNKFEKMQTGLTKLIQPKNKCAILNNPPSLLAQLSQQQTLNKSLKVKIGKISSIDKLHLLLLWERLLVDPQPWQDQVHHQKGHHPQVERVPQYPKLPHKSNLKHQILQKQHNRRHLLATFQKLHQLITSIAGLKVSHSVKI